MKLMPMGRVMVRREEGILSSGVLFNSIDGCLLSTLRWNPIIFNICIIYTNFSSFLASLSLLKYCYPLLLLQWRKL